MDQQRLIAILKEDDGGKFSAFANLLKESNKKFNLTSVCDDEGIFYRHFLDSLAGEEFFFKGASVAEVGSGGGFPSVPLKILRDDLQFTLIESTGKKCNFLNEVVDKLGFGGVKVLNIRAEDAGKNEGLRENFNVCCARAVAGLNTLAEYCLPLVKVGGRFIAYKGDCAQELENALHAVKILGGEVEKVVEYQLENCGKRTLIIIRKIKNTPPQYPRGQGKERKNPL